MDVERVYLDKVLEKEGLLVFGAVWKYVIQIFKLATFAQIFNDI